MIIALYLQSCGGLGICIRSTASCDVERVPEAFEKCTLSMLPTALMLVVLDLQASFCPTGGKTGQGKLMIRLL